MTIVSVLLCGETVQSSHFCKKEEEHVKAVGRCKLTTFVLSQRALLPAAHLGNLSQARIRLDIRKQPRALICAHLSSQVTQP